MARRVAIVAGGTAGVGKAIVDALLADGYKICILARGRRRLRELDGQSPHITTIQCDVANAAAVDAAAQEIEQEFGGIDVWINCAMLTSFAPFSTVRPAEFERIVDATFMGQVNGTRAALELMRSRDQGRIINIGSGLSYRAVPLQSAYCAAKHAINGFTASLRSELIRAGSGITLSLVQLPAMNTPQFTWALNRLEKKPQPAPPIYDPEVAARAVMRVIESGEREVLVGKSVLQLVLGQLVVPDWLDRKMAGAGADMQKSDQDEPGGRPNNLFDPVDGISPTADGAFADSAKPKALTVNSDTIRLVALGTVVAASALISFASGVLIV